MTLNYIKKGQSRKSQQRVHYSREENRLTAIREEGKLAYLNNIPRDQNPKVSNQSRDAWFSGWDSEAIIEGEGLEFPSRYDHDF